MYGGEVRSWQAQRRRMIRHPSFPMADKCRKPTLVDAGCMRVKLRHRCLLKVDVHAPCKVPQRLHRDQQRREK